MDGVTWEVESPFLVIATQNPDGSAGTQQLPEAQADRFLLTAALGYPDFEHELKMAMEVGGTSRILPVNQVIDKEELLQMQQQIHQIYMKESVYRYLLELITETRSHPCLERGASPRGTIALVKTAKAMAWLHGESYVTPQKVAEQFPYVVTHRIRLNAAAQMERIRKEQVLTEILNKVKKPPMGEKT